MNLERLIDILESLPKSEILHGAGGVPRWVESTDGRTVLSMVPVPTQTVGGFVNGLKSVVNRRLANDIAFRRDVNAGEAIHIDVVRKSPTNAYIVAELVTDAAIELWRVKPVDTVLVKTAFTSIAGSATLNVIVVKDYWDALNEAGKLQYLRDLAVPKAYSYVNDKAESIYYPEEYWGMTNPHVCPPCPTLPPEKEDVEKGLNGFKP